MTEPLRGLIDAQARVAAHGGGPLLVLGAPGTGKSLALAARAAWLAGAGGLQPHELALVVATPEAARRTRRRLADRLGPGVADVAVATLPDLCRRLLRSGGPGAVEVGFDPFAVPATRTERVGLLLEHREELGLRHHGGGPAPVPLLAAAVARIDRLKEGLVGAADVAAWAGRPDAEASGRASGPGGGAAGGPAAAGAGRPPPHREPTPVEAAAAQEGDRRARTREAEFARLFALHDRLLRERGLVDHGGLLLALLDLLGRDPAAGGLRHVLVDDVQDLPLAGVRIADALHRGGAGLTAAGDDDQATRRARAAATRNLRDLALRHDDLTTIRLERSHRCPVGVLAAAEAVVAPVADRLEHRWHAAGGGTVRFWRAQNERAQAQAVAADVERLLREGADPRRIAVLVPSVREEARPIAVALDERAIASRTGGAGAFLERAEVRDVLAWLRLLVEPGDASAVARALSRAPIELRPADLARCTQIARRRKLDMVSALRAAREAPQVPPDARDRLGRFLRLHRESLAALDETAPDLFVHGLVERLGLRQHQLYGASADVVERLRDLARVGALAERHARWSPGASARDFAHWLGALAEAGGDPAVEVDGGPFAGAAALPEPAPGAEPWEPAEHDAARPVAAVRILPLEAAAELELDHVYVLGLQQARLPGDRSGLVDPIPDGLLREDLPPDGVRARADEARRQLYVAVTRACRGVVLAFPATSPTAGEREPSSLVEDARRATGADWEDHDERLFGPDETLHATFRVLRDELLADVATVGARLGDLRMDTDLDLAHGATRFLELVKVAALMRRPEGLEVAEALPALNAAIEQEATALQKEVLRSSPLDDDLLEAVGQQRDRRRAATARAEPSLEPFLPRRGDGLVLSAGDIVTYRACPLRWKFQRVFRIPRASTTAQRFGILVHQVLERGLAAGVGDAATSGLEGSQELHAMLDAGWRRAGLSGVADEQRLRGLAERAMDRFAAREAREAGVPLWLERSFEFRLGDHTLRGRVDRVDRLPGGGHELIDYKTGRPLGAHQLRDDVQLQLYAVAAREAWGLDAARQTYHYVLDDEKVALPPADLDRDWIGEAVEGVASRIVGQDFEPTPSFAACSACDYRLTCPAAET